MKFLRSVFKRNYYAYFLVYLFDLSLAKEGNYCSTSPNFLAQIDFRPEESWEFLVENYTDISSDLVKLEKISTKTAQVYFCKIKLLQPWNAVTFLRPVNEFRGHLPTFR